MPYHAIGQRRAANAAAAVFKHPAESKKNILKHKKARRKWHIKQKNELGEEDSWLVQNPPTLRRSFVLSFDLYFRYSLRSTR